ncbi:MAG: [protein-PII] uridylyltransferase, partial [Rhodospirillales bacterium]
DMGLQVGHATRSIDECIRLSGKDVTIRTSLLEARWLWGDKKLFQQFRRRFMNDVVAGTGTDFIEAKLAERNARHERMGDTRYVLEPNIKEGKGGLRDLQTLLWIAKYLYRVDTVEDLEDQGVLTPEDSKRFAEAQEFLWTVRCHLHYLTGRAEERLGFDIQKAISMRMNYAGESGMRGVESFMKQYFLIAKDVGDLTRILCAVLEAQQKKRRTRFRLPSIPFGKRHIEGFSIDGDRLTVEGDDDFRTDPVKLIRLFREAQRHDLDIHPEALRLAAQSLDLIDDGLRADPKANDLFMEILTAREGPVTGLTRLNEAGVLGRFIPDFGRVVAQMQYDMYHVYTVDEHTIRAIGILHRIEKGELKDDHPAASSAIGDVQSRQTIYAAVLLHDIAKGREGDHSEVGAEIAAELCPRLGLNEWETETVSWLVLHHLLMSRTAFKRDLDDPKSISDFVEIVQSPERLRLLLILTVADIRAVGPQVWNEWKAGLLRELYYRAMEAMTGGLPSERTAARVERAKAALRDRLSGWSDGEIEKHLARGYPDYWLIFDADTLFHHAKLVRKAESEKLKLHIETRVEKSRDFTEIIIYTADDPGLFARIAGAMALGGASIVDAKIVTLANGMALDTFSIQDSQGRVFDNPGNLKKLWNRIEDSLSGKLHAARELNKLHLNAPPGRIGAFKVPPRVLVDNSISANHTVIEVNGRDRLGFLHDVTAELTGLGLQIASAHITTYGERVVDVFYVKDIYGLKVEHKEKLNNIRESLLEAVTAGDAVKKSGAKNQGGGIKLKKEEGTP